MLDSFCHVSEFLSSKSDITTGDAPSLYEAVGTWRRHVALGYAPHNPRGGSSPRHSLRRNRIHLVNYTPSKHIRSRQC